MLEKVKERRIPYLIAVVLNLYITKYIFNENFDIELHYFFAGISFTSITFLILSYLNYKASLHAAAISGVTMFFAALSIHLQLNLILEIGILIIINGLVATSRLHLKAHSSLELIIGFALGLVPQLMMIIYWV
jgi:membrane-associated phospholipid phosphatase